MLCDEEIIGECVPLLPLKRIEHIEVPVAASNSPAPGPSSTQAVPSPADVPNTVGGTQNSSPPAVSGKPSTQCKQGTTFLTLSQLLFHICCLEWWVP